MINNIDFSKRLNMVMEYYQLSATVFAEKIGVQRSSISHLLSGRNKPSLDFVLKVLEHFKEVELYWFLKGKGTFPSKKETSSSTTISNNDAPIIKLKEKNPQNNIDRIIIFYKDGTFENYTEKSN